MRSHRLALTTLALSATLAAAGCGTGRETPNFGAGPGDGPGAIVQATPAPGAPAPVIVAGADQKVLQERDAAQAAAARSREAAAKAEARRRAARRDLREERAKAARARKRAEERQALLRDALAAKAAPRRSAAPSARPAPRPRPAADAPIAASDVAGSQLAADRDRRSDAEARAAVVRFHELLDRRDARACDLLTPRMLAASYGEEPGAIDRCRTAAAGIDQRVSVTIDGSAARGKQAMVAVVSHLGDSEVSQVLGLVLVDGTWLIDAAQRRAD